MRNIKLVYGMRRFCRGNTAAFLFIGISVILGVIMETMLTADSFNFGFLFIIQAGFIPAQIWAQIGCADIVKASPKRRAVDQKIPHFLMTAVFFLLFTFSLCIRLLNGSLREGENTGGLLIVALCYFLIICYSRVSYKVFVPSTVFFVILYIPLLSLGERVLRWEDIHGPLFGGSIALAILVCYLILILGTAAGYLLARLFYKRDVDKLSMDASLRKYMR